MHITRTIRRGTARDWTCHEQVVVHEALYIYTDFTRIFDIHFPTKGSDAPIHLEEPLTGTRRVALSSPGVLDRRSVYVHVIEPSMYQVWQHYIPL